MSTLRETIARNIKKLQHVRGLNDRQVSNAAKQKGSALHPTTVAKFKNATSSACDSLGPLAIGLGVEPDKLLNPLGFDDNGNPKGTDLNFPKSALEFAIDAVFNLTANLDINDRDWIKNTIKLVALTTAEDGEKAGTDKLLYQLAHGTFDKR